MKNNLMQLVRLVAMVLAVAGIIYALEFMERGIAVWFWITLLGVGFVGLLYTFRLTQRRVRPVPGASRSASKKSAAAAGDAEALRRTDFRGRMAMTAATVRASGAAMTPLTVGKFCRTLCDSVLSRPVFCYLCILFERNYDGSKG